MTGRTKLVSLTVLITCFFSSSAFALGVLIPETGGDAQFHASRTLVTRTPEGLTFQMTEIDFEVDEATSHFVWLLPVAASGTLELDRCEGTFDELTEITEPRILVRRRGYVETGTGCSGNYEQETIVPDIGAYTYSGNALSAEPDGLEEMTEYGELDDWIDSYPRDLTIPQSAAGTLVHYIDHAYRFVAIPADPTFRTGRVCVQATYQHPTGRSYDYLLPLKTAATTTVSDMEILVYAIEAGRVRPYVNSETGEASYYASELSQEELHMTDQFTTNYETLFTEAVHSRPVPTFVVEYSDAIESPPSWAHTNNSWLTRLRINLDQSILPVEDRDPEMEYDADLALEITNRDEIDRDYQIIIAAISSSPSTTLFACAFALIGVTLVVRRRTDKRGFLALFIGALLLGPALARAEDPLDSIDGTEGWSDIDTSSVDESEAWQHWQRDLARWEAGRARIEAERARMAEIRRRAGAEEETVAESLPPEGTDHQSRIDGARRMTGTGQPTRRDGDGQAIDDERPWSRR